MSEFCVLEDGEGEEGIRGDQDVKEGREEDILPEAEAEAVHTIKEEEGGILITDIIITIDN